MLLPQLRSLNLARNKLQHLQPLKVCYSYFVLCWEFVHVYLEHRQAATVNLIVFAGTPLITTFTPDSTRAARRA